MNIEKLLELGTEYFSDYFSVFISTLRTPAARFRPITKKHEETDVVLPTKISSSYVGPDLNPRLFGFMMISILIGATLNSVVPGRPPSPDLLTTSVITIAVWIGYSISVFLVCKILGGKGSFLETISVSLQLLAVIYVVSNFVAFIWGSIAQTRIVRGFLLRGSFGLIVDYPIFVYYPVQFVLMLVYLPAALKHVHRFSVVRQLVVGIVPIAWTLWATVFFLGSFVRPSILSPTPTSTPPLVLLPTNTASPGLAPTSTRALIVAPTAAIAKPSLTPTSTQVLIVLPTPTATLTPTDTPTPIPTHTVAPTATIAEPSLTPTSTQVLIVLPSPTVSSPQ
jgi:hypothetical protein